MNPHLVATRHLRLPRHARRACLSLLSPRRPRGDDVPAIPVAPGRVVRCAPPRLEDGDDGTLRLAADARVEPPGPLLGRLVVHAAVVDADGTAMIGNRLPVDDVVAVLRRVDGAERYAVDARLPVDGRLAGVLASGLGLSLSIGWDGRPDVRVGATWYRCPRTRRVTCRK